MSFRVHPGPPRYIRCTACRRGVEVHSELHERNFKLRHVCVPLRRLQETGETR